ncbi:3-phosphoshikimate 1-carboxyvinyltransferase [Thalassotalea sp. 1_MG-2023]|uniref:3-phosphoshikimate 1-carboxyvinyltransferase n=1 Tax=Thalassotalea sp. 1_MG-2023 TaxID=3062680 RepID=UPI0026E1CF21|nr:3-phosphoshikimate 1-carboxyvinyltransferase [Thalassotalea sp. 1_MG-2023]MDO6426950.1 3-phosphoshikimate 1-carboxyvinyltransferase [Thalassotalea sp. 1_MG-2023]
MEQLTVQPIGKINGEVFLPGSKSLSNRALLIAALANGVTKITNLLVSDDIKHMLNALTTLGVEFTLSDCGTECTVIGNGGFFKAQEKLELYLGNAGTAMRPLCAALAASEGEFVLTGEPRMKERPIGHLVDALAQLNADIEYLENIDYPPVNIRGKALSGSSVTIDGSISSQFLTAILMITPLLTSDTQINIEGELVSKPYIDITLDIMKRFGVTVQNNNYQSFQVTGNQSYQAVERYMVEGDASSASYFLAAGAIKGGEITVHGVGTLSVQGDKHFADVLEKMGAEVTWQDESITVKGKPLTAVDMDMNHIPDAAMTIATTALFAKGTTTIRNIYNWRVKETDRLTAMATELRKVGAEVVEGEDYISITPPETLNHAEIDTYNDHRVAMCFSLVALSQTPITINDPKCTAKTFPDYFTKLADVSC